MNHCGNGIIFRKDGEIISWHITWWNFNTVVWDNTREVAENIKNLLWCGGCKNKSSCTIENHIHEEYPHTIVLV